MEIGVTPLLIDKKMAAWGLASSVFLSKQVFRFIRYYSGTPIQRYATGAVELDRYIEASLYWDSRYNDIAVK